MATRTRLCRWTNWFALVNAVLLGIVGLRYLWHYSALSPSVSWSYALVAYAGQLSAIAYVPLLLLVPVMLVIPRPRVVLALAVVLSGTVLSFLLLDTLLFSETRYHLSALTVSLLAPQTWAFLVFYFLVGVAIESMLAWWLWKRTAHPPARDVGWLLMLVLAGCLLSAHLLHLWAHAHHYVPVTSFNRYLPLYYPLRDTRFLVRLGLVDRARAREQGVVAALSRPPDRALNYPLAPLRCEPHPPMLNVLLVVIDAMRADALRPATAPNMSEFTHGALRFDAHYSGGNSSRAGMFSLFYGLPATYWDAFADGARPPVLMDLFREYRYQLGLFASAPVYRGAVGLDRTALARIPGLRLETGSPYPGSSGKDRTVTDEWLTWLDRRDPARPFLGFLYYNSAVAIEPPDDYPSVVAVPAGAPAQVALNARYLTAVHFIDSLLGRVFDDLRRRKLLERTVVIITSDHGMEFDENGLGFAGHGTAFSEVQLHTPMLIRWPGRAGGRVTRRTSHNDLAPTLLTDLFGCANPPSDYASGVSLYSGAQWDWLIATSYADFALVEPDRVTIILPAGYEIRDRSYRLSPNPTLPRDVVRAATKEMGRFYR